MERRSGGWPRPVVAGFGALVAALYTFGSVKLAADRSHFIADDLVAFWLIGHTPFRAYLAQPLDIHLAPLHRLVTYGVHALWPMNFRAALGVLATFHLAAALLLYATLERLAKTAWSWAFLGLYATHVYLPLLFFWWTAALHRLPCIAFSLAAIYAYVRFRDGGRWAWVAALCAAELCAFGFFVKAALVPFALAGIEACEWRTTDRAARRRHAYAVALSVLVAVAYVSIWYVRVPWYARAVAPNARYLANGIRWSWTVLFESTLGLAPSGRARLAVALVVWLGVLGWTIRRGRDSAIAWAALAGTVSLSMFITVAPLTRYVFLQGNAFELVSRYYFELMLPFVLFLSLASRDALGRTAASASGQKALEAFIAVVLVVSAIHSFRTARTLASIPPYSNYAKQRALILNLQHDLGELRSRGEDVVLVDAEVPPFSLGWAPEWRRQSRLLEAMGIPATFAKAGGYRITEDGHVVRVRK